MFLRTVALVFFMLVITAGLKVGNLLFPSIVDITSTSYKCEGECVPVYFEVHVPEGKSLYSQVFVSGSFNGWVHGDPGLQLTKIDGANYSATIFLPEHDIIKYRYTVGRDQKHGFAEYGDLRSIRIMDSHVRQDSVSEWGAGFLMTGTWKPEKLERQNIQWLFIDKELPDSIFTHPITPARVDSLFMHSERLWAEEGILFYPGYEPLLSRTYVEVYNLQMVRGGHTENRAAECQMKAQYALPAFLREVEYVEARPQPPRNELLGSLPLVIDAVHCDNLSEDQHDALDALFYKRMPKLLRSTFTADTDTLKRSHYMRFMNTYISDYTFLRSLRSGDLSTARQVFEETVIHATVANSGVKHEELRRWFMVRQLVNAFVKEGNVETALEILDEVTLHTSGLELSSDTLRGWYKGIAGKDGIERFSQLNARSDRENIQGEGTPIVLSGLYLNITDSTRFDLGQLEGKVVVIDFWATHCATCIGAIPELNAFHSSMQARDDVVFISVSEDKISRVQSPLKQLENVIRSQKITYPVLYDNPDNPISAHFPVEAYPARFVLDKEGRLVSEINSVISIY